MVPLLLIMVLNIGSFAMPVHALNDRLQYSVNLFLSAFALMYVIAPDVPKTNYQTPIDRFVLVTVVVLACTGMHAVLLTYLKAGDATKTCFPAEYDLDFLLGVFRFWNWGAECTDRVAQVMLIGGYLLYIVYEFSLPKYERDQWLDEQLKPRAHVELTALTTVNGQVLKPPCMLRLDGLEHHTSQILKNPYAGAPTWLVKKYGIDADVSLDVEYKMGVQVHLLLFLALAHCDSFVLVLCWFCSYHVSYRCSLLPSCSA
jgi:hypothetical protein